MDNNYNSSRGGQTPAGVFHHRESLAHDVVERFSSGQPLLEFRRLGLEFLIGELLVTDFQLIDPAYQRTPFFEISLAFGSENRF